MEVRTQVSTAAPTNASEALEMVSAGLGWLAAADPTDMASEGQAECLRTLERLDAIETAARAWILSAFTAGLGYSADADYSPRAWLIHKTRITKGAAAGHLGWARRATTHPQVVTALAEGTVLTESMARTICGWSDKLPQECRPAADEILVAAARAGADQRTLAELAAEIYTRSLPAPEDDGADDSFDDRAVRVETTFEGAGIISGSLTPECAAVVSAVLEALSAPAGAEDTRSRDQRYHDGLQQAMERLIAAGLLPERAGQPVKAWVHVSLAELRAMDDGSVLQAEWITATRARWAAHRAAASVSGGDGAAWLDGDAARAAACDASLIPVVTGDLDMAVLDELVNLCVQLAGHGGSAGPGQPGEQGRGADPAGEADPAVEHGEGAIAALGRTLTAQAREMLEHAIIGKAVDLVSGPGGLASFLRRRQLDAGLAGPSLPLDVGRSADIPAAIRRAVILRDQGCRWPGGCDQPAAGCEVHHVVHLADGGTTSVRACILFCWFHHHIAIHKWGWTVVLNPDGTTTARSPDGTKVLRSHGPPPRPG
jgi:Domain of unknown function (DUF222)